MVDVYEVRAESIGVGKKFDGLGRLFWGDGNALLRE